MSFADNFLKAVQETSVLEWIAVLCGIVYVILAAYRKLACWFFGLISSAIYVYLCFISQLYIETGLQIFYIAMSFYGWITWNAQKDHVIKIRMRSFQFHIYTLAIGLVMAFLLGYFFEKNTNQASAYLDASIGVFSLIATFMTANRVLENWIYWIVVDFAAIFLYASRDLALSALLYGMFTIMAIYALIQWTKQYRSQKNNADPNSFSDQKPNFAS